MTSVTYGGNNINVNIYPVVEPAGIKINTSNGEVYLKDDSTASLSGTPQQLIFNFSDSTAVSDVFNVTSGDVSINSAQGGGVQYYADTISISTGFFGNKATLGTYASATNLVDDAETKIFTFTSSINLANITTSTLTSVTYGGNNINVTIV